MHELLQNQARAVSSAPDQEDAVVPTVAAWMPGAILQSKGFYELAAQEYTRLLLQSPPLLAGGAEFVINQTTDCYARLADWEALNKWLPQIGNYTAKLQVDKPVSLSFDGNYLQALTKFDQGDYGAASGNFRAPLPTWWHVTSNSFGVYLQRLWIASSWAPQPARPPSIPSSVWRTARRFSYGHCWRARRLATICTSTKLCAPRSAGR
jgi:hypothetical protein